jgi:hypothetical protein
MATVGPFCAPISQHFHSRRGSKLRADYQFCTAFIIDSPPDDWPDKLHLTAGHCFAIGGSNGDQRNPGDFILQFDVPLSCVCCTIVHPPPASQFPVDTATWTWPGFNPKPPGNDWAVFQCKRQGGVSTFMHNGRFAFGLAAPPPPGAPVWVTGYGVDGADLLVDPNECGGAVHHCDPGTLDAVLNGTQQTDSGFLLANDHDKPTVLNFIVDICAANSGSPIIDASNKAVGIVTHAGCKGAAAHNHGQPILTTPPLMAAIAHEKDKKVPAMTNWGFAMMALLVVAAGVIVVRRRAALTTG